MSGDEMTESSQEAKHPADVASNDESAASGGAVLGEQSRPRAELIDEAMQGIMVRYGEVLRRLADS